MNAFKTLFAELMAFIPFTSFVLIVDRYGGNAGVRLLCHSNKSKRQNPQSSEIFSLSITGSQRAFSCFIKADNAAGLEPAGVK